MDKEHEGARALVKDREKQARKREREKVAEKIEDKPREKDIKLVDTNHEDQKTARQEEVRVSGGKAIEASNLLICFFFYFNFSFKYGANLILRYQ